MSESPKRLACDPVCGRELTEEQSLLSAAVNGDTYLFCSERCRMLFSIRPGWFLERTEPRPSRRAS
jgi:YHS domain-containing protein